MAITINIYYSGANGNARKFAEEMSRDGIAEKIRAEKGNLRYEYFFPMDDACHPKHEGGTVYHRRRGNTRKG